MTMPVDRLDFTPVPVAPRHDGWTAERQRAFIAALADTGCVSDACDQVGVTARSAYRLRRRADAAAFDRAWTAAVQVGAQRLIGIAMERAVYGTVRTHRHNGEVVGEEMVPDNRLLMFLLSRLDPVHFGQRAAVALPDAPDPHAAARAALPDALAALVDIDARAEPVGVRDYAPAAPRPPFER